MHLSVKERLVLISVLPREGDFLTLKSLRKVREALSFTEEEQRDLDFTSEGGVINWNEVNKDDPRRYPIEIPKSIHDLIVAELKQLNEQKKLTDDIFEVYEMFIEEEE